MPLANSTTTPDKRRALGRLLVVFLWTVLTGAASPAARAGDGVTYDSVEQLRLTLRVPVLNTGPESGEVSTRLRRLQERIAPLERPTELREALLLQEWRDGDVDERLAAVDRAVRTELIRRLEQTLRNVFDRGEPVGCLAAANLLNEVAPALQPAILHEGLFRSLGPSLAELTRTKNPTLQAAAASALGKINPDAEVAVAAFRQLLSAEELTLRRAGADGVYQLAHCVVQSRLRVNGKITEPVRRQTSGLFQILIPATATALQDPDAEVRKHGVEAQEQIAFGLGRLLQDQPGPEDGEAWTLELVQDGNRLSSLANELKEQTEGFLNAVHDPDPAVRLAVYRAIETMGRAWLGDPDKSGRDGFVPQSWVRDPVRRHVREPLVDRLRATFPDLAEGIRDADVENRRAWVNALEVLGPEGMPAAPQMVEALKDRDAFVRWGAARCLGGLAPTDVPGAIDGLIDLLYDKDVEVRWAAMTSLRRYGPCARYAVPALSRAVQTGDAESRLAAIGALEGIGVNDYPCISSLGEALACDDSRVRVASARLLGKFGPAAVEVRDALHRALADEDGAVRQAAGEALLAILPTLRPAPEMPRPLSPPPATLHPERVAQNATGPLSVVVQAAAWQTDSGPNPAERSRATSASPGRFSQIIAASARVLTGGRANGRPAHSDGPAATLMRPVPLDSPGPTSAGR